jgi:RecJ-like exonuclease
MNEAEAKRALRRPLKFGDDEQIRAIRFLGAVDTAVEQIKESPECEECQGDGRALQHELGCEDCGGSGCSECEYVDDCTSCNGLGYFVIDWPACKNEIMEVAIRRIKKEKEKN